MTDAARARRLGVHRDGVRIQRIRRGIAPQKKGRLAGDHGLLSGTTSRRHRIWKRDGGRCQACGTPIRFKGCCIHHVIHRGYWVEVMDAGGSPNIDSNLITLCSGCHQGDGGVHARFALLIASGYAVTEETFRLAIEHVAMAHRGEQLPLGIWTPSKIVQAMDAMYRDGKSARDIAPLFNCSYATVIRRLRELGTPIRGPHDTQRPRQPMVRPEWLTDEILATWSMPTIAKRAGCSRGPVQRWRRESGITGQIGGARDRCKIHEQAH